MNTAHRVKSTPGNASHENQSGASDDVSLPRNLHITTGKDRAIEISGLHFYWKSPTASVLDIESLWVNKGQSIFIEGPSGSGKSTLLSLVAGVLTPQQGDVIVLGHRLNALNSAQRDHFRSNHVGVIFQMFNLIPYLSVVENVLLPCRFSRLRRDKALRRGDGLEAEARRLLAHLDMDYPALLSCPVTELSVGQQQRVAAARALIGAPEIVIADEPTSSLDAEYRHSFMQLLFEECQQAQATLIFVSHDTSMTSLFDRHVRLSEINRADQVATRRIPGGA